jgi:hypothetical protein
MALRRLVLADGAEVSGFLCEPPALAGRWRSSGKPDHQTGPKAKVLRTKILAVWPRPRSTDSARTDRDARAAARDAGAACQPGRAAVDCGQHVRDSPQLGLASEPHTAERHDEVLLAFVWASSDGALPVESPSVSRAPRRRSTNLTRTYIVLRPSPDLGGELKTSYVEFNITRFGDERVSDRAECLPPAAPRVSRNR